jgi:F-type H+-transporting ATPase subunit epsilon
MPVGEVTQEIFDEFVATAVSARDHATPELRDQLAKQVGDIAEAGQVLGLNAKIN